MAISTAMCTSFKQEILVGTHNFTATTGNTFKLALFTSSASLGASTTAFATTNEVSGTGYSSGGSNLTFSSATITANGALIYNSSASNKAVCALAFGGDKTSTAGDFTVQFPTADASNAIIRIA